MGSKTEIQWTDHTFNPWIGCTKVSPGCANCYAEKGMSATFKGVKWGKGQARERTVNTAKDVMRWHKKPWICDGCGKSFVSTTGVIVPDHQHDEDTTLHRARVFCGSQMDWLDDEVPIEWLVGLLGLIQNTPNLTWQLLTKRPENFATRLLECERASLTKTTGGGVSNSFTDSIAEWRLGAAAPANVWIGTSIEDQERAKERIPKLLAIPAVKRFLSVEPLLGPIDFHAARVVESMGGPQNYQPNPIDWVIVGGESGPQARPCNDDWIRSIVKQCRVAHVPVFVKQLGAFCTDRNDAGFEGDKGDAWPMDTHTRDLDPGVHQGAPVRVMLKHKKGGDPAEWPEDLRVREFPET